MAATTTITANFDLKTGIIDRAKFLSLQKELMQRIVLTAEGSVKRVTPVLTGALRRSVTGSFVSVTEGVVGSNLVYAPVVHRHNPYLVRGWDEAAPSIDALFAWFAEAVVAG